jgi:hypothetical protein
MNEQAEIRYYLSEPGRRDSLRKGGDGRREQREVGPITDPDDLELFKVDEEGGISFDATTAPTHLELGDRRTSLNVSAPDKPGAIGLIEVEWKVVPSWDDLLQFARWVQNVRDQHLEKQYLECETEEKAAKTVADAFLADPNARAEKITEGGVTIGGLDFYSSNEQDEGIVGEARARAARDDEELKKANRATLAKWTAHHGTSNQRQRLAAGLLPWKEIYEAAEAQLYAALSAFPLYKRFELQEVCKCTPDGRPNVKFQSVDTVELTAEEWEQYSKIRAAVPRATFQLREHRAACQAACDPQIRRGVIVKVSLGNLSFKREFALTEVSHDAL